MACRRLKRLGFSEAVKQRLNKQNFITCKDILSRCKLELLRALGLNECYIDELIHTTCKACLPTCRTALQLLEDQTSGCPCFLQTTLSSLDKVLHGGLRKGTITEIAGPSGCGKTQLCFLLTLVAALPQGHCGLDGSVIYIDTESAFSAERLVEMAQCRFPEYCNDERRLLCLTGRVRVCQVTTGEELLTCLQSLEEEIISKGVKLVVLDSIASLVRKEFDPRCGPNLIARTNLLAKQAAILKRTAEAFSIPVVVTNQITTRFGNAPELVNNQVGVEGDGEGGYVTAALGNTWSHSVNTRLIVQYLDTRRRQILVAKSPVAPFSTFVFTVQNSGIVLEDNGADHYDGTDPGLQKIQVRSSLPDLTTEGI